MASLTDYAKGELIKHIFRTGTFTTPANWYVALYTTATTDAGGGTEVTGAGYARIPIAPTDANFSDQTAGDGTTSNLTDVTFAAPTADWGNVTHMAIHDAITGGNMFAHKELVTPKTISNGTPPPVFSAGDLTIIFG